MKATVRYVKDEFDNVHENQRGFVIGGGPSLKNLGNKTIEKLKEEVTVGVNKAYNLFTPTYLLFCDPWFWDNFKHEILNLDSKILCPHTAVPEVDKKEYPKLNVFKRGSTIVPKSITGNISTSNNAGTTALRIANILGLNPVYLLGVDLKPENILNREYNFHNDYGVNRYEELYKAGPEHYEKFSEAFLKTINKMDSRVVSCSPDSVLNGFITYKDVEEVL